MKVDSLAKIYAFYPSVEYTLTHVLDISPKTSILHSNLGFW